MRARPRALKERTDKFCTLSRNNRLEHFNRIPIDYCHCYRFFQSPRNVRRNFDVPQSQRRNSIKSKRFVHELFQAEQFFTESKEFGEGRGVFVKFYEIREKCVSKLVRFGRTNATIT